MEDITFKNIQKVLDFRAIGIDNLELKVALGVEKDIVSWIILEEPPMRRTICYEDELYLVWTPWTQHQIYIGDMNTDCWSPRMSNYFIGSSHKPLSKDVNSLTYGPYFNVDRYDGVCYSPPAYYELEDLDPPNKIQLILNEWWMGNSNPDFGYPHGPLPDFIMKKLRRVHDCTSSSCYTDYYEPINSFEVFREHIISSSWDVGHEYMRVWSELSLEQVLRHQKKCNYQTGIDFDSFEVVKYYKPRSLNKQLVRTYKQVA